MNASIENMLCIFCKNTTITTTEKSASIKYNKSEDDDNESRLYSICMTCNKYSYIEKGTLLYNEKTIKNSNKLVDIKYDPKLIEIDGHCSVCESDTTFKQFASSNYDLKYKYICVKCDTFFDTV